MVICHTGFHSTSINGKMILKFILYKAKKTPSSQEILLYPSFIFHNTYRNNVQMDFLLCYENITIKLTEKGEENE